MKYEIFISYSRKDKVIVDKIQEELSRRGISYFVDKDNIDVCEDFAAKITRSIKNCDILLFVWSENSNLSVNTANEIAVAIEFGKEILPFKIGNFKPNDNLFYHLVRLNRIETPYYDENLISELADKIVKRLKKYSQLGLNTDSGATGLSVLKVTSDMPCYVYVDGKNMGIARPHNILHLELQTGTYFLNFKSISDENVYMIDQTYYIEKDTESFYKVELFNNYRLNIPDNNFIISEKDGKYGFIDKYGKELISCVYNYAWNFENGIAVVKQKSKFGLINKAGEEFIPCVYDDIINISEGMVAVLKDNYCGFIDYTGEEVTPLIYLDTLGFSESMAAVFKDNKWGAINMHGKEIVPCIYDCVGNFNGSLAIVKQNNKWGFVNNTGDKIVPLIYDNIQLFSENIAAVNKNGKWGFIDKTGREIIHLIYDDARSFCNGLAAVQYGNKYGFIDKEGNTIIPFVYDEVFDFSNGTATVKKNNRWGEIDQKGGEIERFEFNSPLF